LDSEQHLKNSDDTKKIDISSPQTLVTTSTTTVETNEQQQRDDIIEKADVKPIALDSSQKEKQETKDDHKEDVANKEDSTSNNDDDKIGKSSSDNSIQENLTIPVFSEWTQQQQMQEQKKLVELTGNNSTEANKDTKNETILLAKHQTVKMRQKNYASPDCGAKILSSNPEAQSASSVLSDKKDEYMLSPCTDRIWFVIELCDSIQAQRVELANFELFSSPLKSVSISVSNRYPTREWTLASHYEAKSERDVQVVDLTDVTLFGKFVRVSCVLFIALINYDIDS
jgi:hypothetical protein